MERIIGKIKRRLRKLDVKGATAKVMSAVLIASSVLNAVTPAIAYAAETEPNMATVTLAETEHGQLSFEDTDMKSVTVEVGGTVTVTTTPDDGYFADSLTIFDDEDNGTAVDLEDGKATFEVTGDTIVTGTFYENGTVGSDALKAVDVSEGKAYESVESYIQDHADPQYVGSEGELTRKDVLTVTTTVVDGNKLPNATIDALWDDADGDGMSDNWTAMLSQAVSHAVLFEIDPDSDYYVGWAGAEISGGKLTDWAAAENNADANMRDGFIVDEATGLVYVPKSYTELNEDGEPMVASSRIQLLYTTADSAAEVTFDFTSSNSGGVSGDVADTGKVSVSASAANTKVTLATDEESLASLQEHSIDSVTVNGIEYTSDMDMWSYDEETGTLEFKMAPAGVHAMSVQMSNNLGKDVMSVFSSIATFATARSASVNNIGTWEFNSAPYAGLSFTTSGRNTYNGSTAGYTLPAVENPSGGNYENKTIYQAMGWQGVDTSKLQSGRYSIERTAEIYAQKTNVVNIPTAARLALTCGHVGVNANFQADSGYNEPAAMSDTLGQHIQVVAVYGNTAIIGVTVPTSHTQAGAGFFEITWKIGSGQLKIQKSSANTSITNGNDCYSLEGAVFTVYNASGSAVGTLTTDANGNTGTIELPEGTYTVKETTAPKGYYKAADQTVTVTGGQTATLKVSDEPAGDPMFMLLGKYDGEKTYNGEANLPQGAASLAGAEFTVEYYDTLDYDSYDDLKDAKVEPTRSWVVSTDEDGYCDLSTDYLVSGDEFYYDTAGSITIPRGTVVIYESKAPTGYKLNDDVSFQKIQDEPTEGVITYNMPEVPDSIIRGGVSVQKLDAQTGETPQGDASFEGIEFSIINDNENDVIVDGKSYAPGAVVMTITTDEDGFASTADDALPYGDYIIRETGTNDGYLNTSEDMHATVSEDGKVYSFTASDDVVRGGVKVTKRDLETGQFSALGAASLEGTTFEVLSLNDNPVTVEGVRYSKGDSVATLTIHDGEAATASDLLPYGTYALHEVKAGEGYRLTDDIEFYISLDGEIVGEDGELRVRDQVKRGDLEFTKKAEDTGNRLAGVAFKMTSQTTGESHVIVTDENGYFSSASSWNKHTDGTNGNDWALTEDGTIDSSKLDSTSGLWFGGTDPDDSNGALPYDTYTIEELRCTANEGYQLIETSIIVSRDAQVYDFGTLDDIKASIVTNAYDPDDSDSYIGVGEVKVADKVTYSNLVSGRDYTLVAELHDASTGDALKGADGKAVTVEKTFTASESSGSEVVELSLSTFDLGGKTITVYEKLYDHGGSLIAEHADKDDVSQQVTVIEPEIGTTAVDGADGDKTVSTDDAATVVDTVSYRNLIPGKEYTVKGTLHVKKTDKDGTVTEEVLEVDGKAVTAETTFVPETADGTVDVTFTFDSLSLKDGTQLVAFESLEHAGHELAVHADIEDVGQTVTVKNPTIATTALDGVDNDKNVVTDDETVIVDTVEYHNLVPGKEYVLNGTLHVKDTGDALEVDGKAVTAQTAFTPEASDGTVNVTFTFDSRSVSNKTELVVFESLARDGKELTTHEDIEDVNQMVVVTTPSIGTTALDGVDGDKNVVTDDETTIVDTVEYKNLVPGKEYVLNGTLYVKDTGEPLEVDGKPVTAQTVFTPETADGTVDVTFTFDSRNIGHQTQLVAFESLERSGVELATHADIEDDDQTTTVIHPEIGTTAVDGVDGDKNVVTDDVTTIVDTVEYKNVIPGKEYTVKGTLHVKKTDKDGNVTEEELLVDGKPVTAETTFTPEETKGTVDVTFTFDSRHIENETDIVVFESLERSGVEIAAHADIEDDDQTTTVTHPEVGTTAADGHDGDKNVVTDGVTTIVDTVEYKNVIPGKEYTVKGTLHVKKTDSEGNVTDEVLLDAGGNPVTAETTFTPEETKGTVDMTFTFDSTAVEDGTEIVAFESLERVGVEIAAHADIEDDDQTTTARVTSIGTTATDGLDGDKTVIADAETTVTDSVEYENALSGTPYTMAGILMDADTGLPILTGDGSEKYTDADVADFMAQLLDVLGLSAENEEGYAEVPVSDETDGDAVKAQSVRVYTDGTYEVIDSVTGTDEDGLGFATVDSSGKVAYDDLTDEQKEAVSDVAVIEGAGVILNYSGTGELPADFDADALAQLFADNADLVSHMVCQTAEFTPEKDDGTVSMDFGFNANDVIDRLSGETKDIVVFEVMFKGSLGDEDGGNLTIVASECDLDSEEQTVVLTPSTIGTTAVDKSDGDHELLAGQDAVITDTVEYEGLIPGKEYTLKATLMDKETGEPLSVNDQHVTAELKFTPNSQSGSVDIDLGKFDASDLDGHDLVVFEELYKQTTDDEGTSTDVLVAEHKDIEDEGQTVTVTTTPPGGFFGKTGGNTYFIVLAIAALVVLAGGCTVYAVKNRRSAKGGSADDAPAEADGNETDGTDGSENSEA